MNLQEIINHRSTCFIHDLPMNLGILGENKGIIVSKNDEGILLSMKNCEAPGGVSFRYDGTIAINEKQEALRRLLSKNVSDTLQQKLIVSCSECKNVPFHKSRTLGATTLSDIRNHIHAYTFILSYPLAALHGQLSYPMKGTYGCTPVEEVVKYHRDDKFYHMSADLGGTGGATFKMGSCKNTEIVNQLLDSLMHFDVPRFDPARIKSLDQLVSKIKLYNLFS